MMQREQLVQWECEAVALDEDGVSEAYFPLWGIADVEGYLAQSDRVRRAKAEAREAAEAEQRAEAEMAAAAEALAHAVANATGRWIKELPITGEKIVMGAS